MTVTEKMHYHKVCARCVPKVLTGGGRKHKTSALMFLQQYNNDKEKFLDHVVTGDKTWISYSNNETQQQSMVWKHSG
jgi:hypothetical protein